MSKSKKPNYGLTLRTDKIGSYWSLKGELHRLSGPAVIGNDGYKAWYQYGKLHRVNGPAIVYPDGSNRYYAFNIEYQSLKELNIAIILDE